MHSNAGVRPLGDRDVEPASRRCRSNRSGSGKTSGSRLAADRETRTSSRRTDGNAAELSLRARAIDDGSRGLEPQRLLDPAGGVSGVLREAVTGRRPRAVRTPVCVHPVGRLDPAEEEDGGIRRRLLRRADRRRLRRRREQRRIGVSSEYGASAVLELVESGGSPRAGSRLRVTSVTSATIARYHPAVPRQVRRRGRALRHRRDRERPGSARRRSASPSATMRSSSRLADVLHHAS